MSSISYFYLVEKHHNYLQQLALHFTKNKADASDLLQDTFAHLLRKETNFEMGTDFKAWSSTIMKNIFFQGHRRKRRRGDLLKIRPLSAVMPWEKNKGECRLIVECVEGVINQLEEKLRLPFQLHYKGFKYEEIAKRCDIPLGTVKNRIFLARKRLRKREAAIMACF